MGTVSQQYVGGSLVNLGTAEETPKSLRKRAKQLEKAAKAKKHQDREREERRQVAIAALVRVANGVNNPADSIVAARELLRMDGLVS